MIANDTSRGKQIKGEVPCILGKESPMTPLTSSSIWRSWTGMERHLTPSGGLMGGVPLSPPSQTIISESINVVDIMA